MKYKAVIFDLDDTLFDRNAAQIRVVELIAEQLPQIFHDHRIEQITGAFLESDRLACIAYDAGAPSNDLRRKRSKNFLKILGIKEDCEELITEMYLRYYRESNLPITSTVPIVKEISKHLPVAVISNGMPDTQYDKIKAIGLDNVFSHVVLSEEIGIRKPDSRIFQHTADLLKVGLSECLYIGDSYSNDVVGAKTAGMKACWFKRESADAEGWGIQPDFVINSLGELINILNL
ncbi:HAD family hydrolase [Chloroflexota bacterium]